MTHKFKDYAFNKEERAAIMQALESYRPTLLDCEVPEDVRQALIDGFITHVEGLCGFFKEWFSDAPTRAAHREDLQEISKSLKATLRKLRTTFVPRVWDMADQFNHKALVNSLRAKKLQELEAPIEEILRILNEVQTEEKKKPIRAGKPSADLDTGLVTQLAKFYRGLLFDKPSLYIDGPFILLVRTVLEILGLKSEDPTRTVRAALKNLS